MMLMVIIVGLTIAFIALQPSDLERGSMSIDQFIPLHIAAWAAGAFMLEKHTDDPSIAWQTIARMYHDSEGTLYDWKALQKVAAEWAVKNIKPETLLLKRWY